MLIACIRYASMKLIIILRAAWQNGGLLFKRGSVNLLSWFKSTYECHFFYKRGTNEQLAHLMVSDNHHQWELSRRGGKYAGGLFKGKCSPPPVDSPDTRDLVVALPAFKLIVVIILIL